MVDNEEFDEEQDRIDRGMMEAQVKEQMAEDVKAKIAQMLHGNIGQQVVEVKTALDYLVRVLGVELATVLCSLTRQDLNAFRKTKITKRGPKVATPLQSRNIAAAYMVVDILVSSMSPDQAREWLISYNEYLFGVPAMELRIRPEDVRMAALHLIAGGS